MRQTQNAQKKDNRKSIFVIGLLLLLVAVIGFGGYTLSKYVTEKKETGSASVAKWGFTVNSNSENLFGPDYKYDTSKSNSVKNNTAGATLTVSASTPTSGTRANLVAPGTTGSMTFEIGGTAEVKATVAVEMRDITDVVLKYKTTANEPTALEYNPVKWTLKKLNATSTYEVVQNADGKSLENVTLAEIATELNTYGATVDANGTYAHAGSYTIEWVWAFDGTAANAHADKLDTLLGWIANGTNIPDGYGFTVETGTNTSIGFTLNISVTQVKGN